MQALAARQSGPKYRQVFDLLRAEILTGKYKEGQKLPSEAALVKRFETSRITVGRAVRELQQQGLVGRRAGSGTYVLARQQGARARLLFGLLIPDLGETEIFEPICQGMANARQAQEHALLWGTAAREATDKGQQAWQLCQQYISQRVSGVFFAPLERVPTKDQDNQRIISALEQAEIPVVLLDRCVLPYPRRSQHDLVGIDNRRAGYMSTEHLLQLGCRRIAFLAPPHAASTVDARIAGYREALFAYGAPVEDALVYRQRLEPPDSLRVLVQHSQPEAIVCANDHTAGQAMHVLLRLGYRIPQDVRIVGIDNLEYASLLPVPLTTVRQPCHEIGEAAMGAMLERIAQPRTPARDILLGCQLVVRESCGTNLPRS